MMKWNDAALACCGVFLPREADRRRLCEILTEAMEERLRDRRPGNGGSACPDPAQDAVFLELAAEVRENRRRIMGLIFPAEAQRDIMDLDLSMRSFNCLRRAGIATVEDLLSRTPEQIASIRNLGKKCQEEIREQLAEYAADCAEKQVGQRWVAEWMRKAT